MPVRSGPAARQNDRIVDTRTVAGQARMLENAIRATFLPRPVRSVKKIQNTYYSIDNRS
jgi:hypothetical protein